jgi:hypothetical protein
MSTDAVAAPVSPPRTRTVMDSIADQLEELSNGDHALLRRMYLTRGRRQADGVVLGLLHRAGIDLEKVERNQELYARWCLVAHVGALLSGTTRRVTHTPHARLGEALLAAGYSENRLLRLTAARGEPLRDQIVRAARVLAQAGETRIDLWAIYHLAAGASDLAEKARIRLAQGYYAAAARSEGDSK